MNLHRSKGMTLIELMVVVLIISILAGIAYPSYRQYAIRANRTEAKTALLQVSQSLEKCYTRYNAYNDGACNVNMSFDTENEKYRISAMLTENTYVLRAAPLGGQADDTTCGTLAMNEQGVRFENTDQAVVPANKCW